MNRIFKIAFLLIIFFLFPKSALAVDHVVDFQSVVYVNDDTSVNIEERILYETDLVKHGIYRYIPYKYSHNGLTYSTKLSDVNVTDLKGNKVTFEKTFGGGNMTLKIGEPNVTFTGEKTYVIKYRMGNVVKRFDGYDELYLDVVGDGWQIPVEKSEAVVIVPMTTIIKTACYGGLYGRDDGLCLHESGSELFEKSLMSDVSTPNGKQTRQLKDDDFRNIGAMVSFPTDKNKVASFAYGEQVSYGKNFSIVLGLEQNGTIIFPSEYEKVMMLVTDNWFLFVLPLPLLVMILLWLYKGRDKVFVSPNVFDMDEGKPQRLRPLFGWRRKPFVYEPLSITPGEAGMMIDEKVDHQDVVAEIIELVRKRYMKIELIEKKQWFGKSRDYKLVGLKASDDKLAKHQKYLLDSLVGVGEEKKLSELKGKFYSKMEKVKRMIVESVTEKKMFTRNPGKVIGGYVALVILMSGLMMFTFIAFINMNPSDAIGLFIFGGIVVFVINLIIAWQMPQKTAVGSNYMLQARGLKETIKRGKWREEIKEKNLFIEEVLPFAICLGVVDRLAKDMKDLNIQAPEYFDQGMIGGMAFSSFVNDFSSHTSNTLSYNPSSSSRSGGSGFSSGGGFSGGGSGGGGGGSW